jgi:hypothetical protein
VNRVVTKGYSGDNYTLCIVATIMGIVNKFTLILNYKHIYFKFTDTNYFLNNYHNLLIEKENQH